MMAFYDDVTDSRQEQSRGLCMQFVYLFDLVELMLSLQGFIILLHVLFDCYCLLRFPYEFVNFVEIRIVL